MHTDSQTEAKLKQCVPHLIAAANDWEAAGLTDARLLIVCASPRHAQVIKCDAGFPDVDGVCGREAAALAVLDAVEAPSDAAGAHAITCGVSLLIGPEGRATHLENAITIRARNQIPVLLFMVCDAHTMRATTVGIAKPTIH